MTRKAIALINHGRVPASLQEEFLSRVNDLGAEAPRCTNATSPAAAASRKAARLEAWLRAN